MRALRKLKKFYPNKENKYLYRCIPCKVPLEKDPDKKEYIPYKEGNKKTFWAFTSTSENSKIAEHFLNKAEGKKVEQYLN